MTKKGKVTMINSQGLSNILKGGILLLLLLNLIFSINNSADASQIGGYYVRYDSSKVLTMARDTEAARKWADAYAYYSIFLDRAPSTLAKDDPKFWFDINRRWENTKVNAQDEIYLAGNIHKRISEGALNRDLLDEAGVYGKYSNSPSPIPGMLGPAPDEILVFKDFNFTGEWMALPIGNYVNASEMQMNDDSISSLMVGSAVRAFLCTNPGLNGTCGVFDSRVPNHHPNLTNNVTGNDSISSIRVEPYSNSCSTGPNEVTVFMHFDFQSPCQTLQVGDYNNAYEFKLPDNGISSIRVGGNVQAYLCRDNNLGDTCETINYNDNNLSDNLIGNDQLSSIRITTRP